jgi:RTX calcium-binding nonapeptide repeat (4 copies)
MARRKRRTFVAALAIMAIATAPAQARVDEGGGVAVPAPEPLVEVTGFDYSDAAIGIGVGVGAGVLAVGAALGMRRQRASSSGVADSAARERGSELRAVRGRRPGAGRPQRRTVVAKPSVAAGPSCTRTETEGVEMFQPLISTRSFVLAAAAFLSALVFAPWASAAGPPANDHFADAQAIQGTTGEIHGFTLGGSKEAGEPNHAGDAGGHSVWYRWTAPGDGRVRFATAGSDFDTLLAVYTGDSLGALTSVAANDDSGGTQQSQASFDVVGGTVYRIAVDGSGGTSGNVLLSWIPVQPNDHFAEAHVVEGTFGEAMGSNVNATRELGEPDHASSGGSASVWYRWTAPADGQVRFDTRGSNFDTLLAVYTGDALGNLTLVGENDDSPLLGCCTSRVAFQATAGIAYQIAVDGYFGEMGSLTLRWSPIIVGTSGADELVGTPGPDEILAGGGNDIILAGEGDDFIVGGAGNDRIRGGAGDDVVRPGRGADVIRAGGGRDAAASSLGNDTLDGGSGNDNLRDYRGADTLLGRAGRDYLDAQDGRANDVVRGGLGRDSCHADRRDVRSSCP